MTQASAIHAAPADPRVRAFCDGLAELIAQRVLAQLSDIRDDDGHRELTPREVNGISQREQAKSLDSRAGGS